MQKLQGFILVWAIIGSIVSGYGDSHLISQATYTESASQFLQISQNAKSQPNPALNQSLESSFFNAIESGNIQRVQACVEEGVNIHAKIGKYGAITIAASNGHSSLLKYLLSLGLSADGEEDEPWSPLLQAKNWEIAKILLEAGANPNKTYFGKTPLELYIEHLPYLLEKGIDIHITPDGKNVILMASPYEETFKLVQKLRPLEQNQKAYDDALFLFLRGDYPYTFEYRDTQGHYKSEQEAAEARKAHHTIKEATD